MVSSMKCWFWGFPVQGYELDLMALVGPFQLRVFCDSMKINVALENFGIYQACWRILPL